MKPDLSQCVYQGRASELLAALQAPSTSDPMVQVRDVAFALCRFVPKDPAHSPSLMEVLDRVLDRGLSVDARVGVQTMLGYAVIGSNPAAIEFLLDRGASPTPPPHPAFTLQSPLQLAMAAQQPTMVDRLLPHADLAFRDLDGTPLLLCALRMGEAQEGMVRRLLALGADPTVVDLRGNTALHAPFSPHADKWSVSRLRVILVELVEHGVDPNRKNHEGKSAMQVLSAHASSTNAPVLHDLLACVQAAAQAHALECATHAPAARATRRAL